MNRLWMSQDERRSRNSTSGHCESFMVQEAFLFVDFTVDGSKE